jgi:hypothetical protein
MLKKYGMHPGNAKGKTDMELEEAAGDKLTGA